MPRWRSRTRRFQGTRIWHGLLVAAAAALAVFWVQEYQGTSHSHGTAQHEPSPGTVSSARSDPSTAFLPAQARQTLALIARGGPFPYPQDGSVFGNYEGHLPVQPRGWYHEYTVDTPGLSHRGNRRIITGGTPPRRYWYTDDHYASFRAFEIPGS